MERAPWWLSIPVALGLVCLTGLVVVWQEVRTSALQSALGAQLASGVVTSPAVALSERPPALSAPGGPWDQARGYAGHLKRAERLESLGFKVVAAARPTLVTQRWAHRAWTYPIYELRPQAGLHIDDRVGRTLEAWRFPHVIWETPPQLARDAAIVLENRALDNRAHAYTNPAVDWTRLGVATLSQVRARVDSGHRAIGGSTLAVQMEKFRHSPGGRTHSTSEKARQTLTAWLRAYSHGRDAQSWSQQLVTDWLNSVPLGHRAGYGPIQGVAEGMWAWYGRSLNEVEWALYGDASDAQRAQIQRELLSLILAQQRPARYLPRGLERLESRVDGLVDDLVAAGKMPREQGYIIASRTLTLAESPRRLPVARGDTHLAGLSARRWSAISGEDQSSMRTRDARVQTTFDAELQQALERELGERSWPSRVSVAVYAHAPGRLEPRAIVDTDPRAVDLATEGRLDLGSTAKLRVLISYLNAVEQAYREMRDRGRASTTDPLGRFVARELQKNPELGLDELLQRALQRRVSADPDQVFYTGGGPHEFQNVNPGHNTRTFNVASAFVASANLPFVRVMEELVAFHAHRLFDAPIDAVLAGDHPEYEALRDQHLEMAAARLVREAYFRHHGKTPDAMVALALDGLDATPERCARLRLALLPGAHSPPPAALRARCGADPGPDASPDGWDAQDPLELAAIAALTQAPDASLSEVMLATREARARQIDWIDAHTSALETRRGITYAMEARVFELLREQWALAGYPFERLTPSLATALGSSGDRPAALARLVAAVRAGGVVPELRMIESARLYEQTPYETWFRAAGGPAQRAFSPEVARAVEALLIRVAERGTGHASEGPWSVDGERWEVGGKTGTSEHLLHIRDRAGRVIERRPMARSGTWVFFAGPCLIGSVVIFEQGASAAEHHFHGGDAAELSRAIWRALESTESGSTFCEGLDE
ncbi:hypothetical protein DL240_06455 [Lujinxingia litoralis]|uniref:peptidoglycan glycosyltransferase n=1 Tax=Lujinxingia litoralis TaxID=2211119 RepID=A0A328CCX8_9DELT|nr:transglycosylase domain-containing protein [Lujinxingia litoralis]RAL23791.1 hypothetical protein DL240_06455 [Lujinxingia litoralis]